MNPKNLQQNYISENMQCEPLHDITNVVQNILTELPHHIKNTGTKTELEKFTQKALGDKNQIKGSDARCIAIKLSKFINDLESEGKIPGEVAEMISCLVEIIHIAYSPESKRNPRQVLRLFNITFLFGVLVKSIIGNPVKLTKRKLYGNHFHSLVTHLPETYRIMNTKTVLTEDEERSFGLLRKLSETTSNRQPGCIIDNAIIRFNSHQQSDERQDVLQKQETVISRLSKQLPKTTRTVFSTDFMVNKASVYQVHLSRIAKYLIPGENVWWHFQDQSVVFHDSEQDQLCNDEGPALLHFRSSTLKKVQNKNLIEWQNCIDQFENKNLSLPLIKFKKRGLDGKLVVVWNKVQTDNATHPVDEAVEEVVDITIDPNNTATDLELQRTTHMTIEVDIHNYDIESTVIDKQKTTATEEENYLVNAAIKRKYRKYITEIEKANKERKLSVIPVKRQLFKKDNQDQIETVDTDIEDMACPFETSDSEEDPDISTEESVEETISTSNIINMVLGETAEAHNFFKYRKLANQEPSAFLQKYQKAKALIETRLLKKHRELKKIEENKPKQLKLVETVLNRWGTYYKF